MKDVYDQFFALNFPGLNVETVSLDLEVFLRKMSFNFAFIKRRMNRTNGGYLLRR